MLPSLVKLAPSNHGVRAIGISTLKIKTAVLMRSCLGMQTNVFPLKLKKDKKYSLGVVFLSTPKEVKSIIVDKLEPVGEGALALAFEQMKAKLQKEGLLIQKPRKSCQDPLTIGLVTSPQGAALRDMLRVMGQRWAGLQIRLAPTRVQGKGAAQEIAQALNRLDEYGDCDVIVLSRGGGESGRHR